MTTTAVLHVIARSAALTTGGYAVALLVALNSLTWPLTYDQAVLSWVGQVILDGGLPYRDAWDLKGPLLHYLYALALAVWGSDPEISIRILDLIFVAGSSWVLRNLALRINSGNTFGADCAVIFFVLSYYGCGVAWTAEPDGWGGMLILGVVSVMLNAKWSPKRIGVAVGGLIALATLIKPALAAFLLIPLLIPIGSAPSLRSHILQVAICLLTFSATVCAGVSALLILGVGAEDFHDVLRYLAVYSQLRAPVWGVIIAAVFTVGSPFWTTWVIPMVCTCIGIRTVSHHQAVILFTWLSVSVLLVFVQGKFFGYHWQPVMIAMSPGIAVAFARVVQWSCVPNVWNTRKAALLFASFALVIGPLAIRSLVHIGQTTKPSTAAAYILTHSGPEDTVFAMGYGLRLNIISQRRSPTRYAMSFPIFVHTVLREKYRRAFVEEMKKAPPILILLQDRYLETANDLAFPDLDEFMANSYVHIARIDGFHIWKRKSPGGWTWPNSQSRRL